MRQIRTPLLWVGCLFLSSFLTAETPYAWKVVDAFPQLQFSSPLYLVSPPDGSNRLFIVEQDGRIRWFENRKDETESDLALDITGKVRRQHMEEGLLGLAFHPKFKSNKKVYLFYSASNPQRSVISEFKMNFTRSTIDPKSEKVLLEVEKNQGNHNGGMMAFGPDGMLYISFGDGGGAGDPNENGQNKKTLLGKIIRIDVDRAESGKNYAIPPDNPFVNDAAARAEIWAYGLRNVWRFSFDRTTGALWAGDVGQDAWEEVDIILKGLNYGWNQREGKHSFSRHNQRNADGPYKEPVLDYDRSQGQSVTGGYVYRGKKSPDLKGAYIYGDFMSGKIWALRNKADTVLSNTLLTDGHTISSFGEDQAGELYFTSLYDGKIYTLQKTIP